MKFIELPSGLSINLSMIVEMKLPENGSGYICTIDNTRHELDERDVRFLKKKLVSSQIMLK